MIIRNRPFTKKYLEMIAGVSFQNKEDRNLYASSPPSFLEKQLAREVLWCRNSLDDVVSIVTDTLSTYDDKVTRFNDVIFQIKRGT